VEEIDGEGGRRGSCSGEASGSAHAGEERGRSGVRGLGDGSRLLYRAEGQEGWRKAVGGGHTGGHHQGSVETLVRGRYGRERKRKGLGGAG
jgi:hypothetical protein